MASTQHKFVIWSVISLVVVLAGCQGNKTNSPMVFKQVRVEFSDQLEVGKLSLKSTAARPPQVFKQERVGLSDQSEAGKVTLKFGAARLHLVSTPHFAFNNYGTSIKSFKTTANPQFKIGVLLPLTGKYSELGKSLLRGMELSFFEVGTQNQFLLIYDTRGTTVGARSAVRSAIRDGAKLLVGPVFSAPSSAVALEKNGESLISISLSNDPNAAASNAFVMGFFPSHRVQRIVSFAAARKLKRFAALLPDDRYGDFVGEAFKEAVSKVGGIVVRIERYSRGQHETLVRAVKRLSQYKIRKNALERQKLLLGSMKDPRSVRKLKRLNVLETLGAPDFDAVLLIEQGRDLTALAPLLPYYEIDIRKVRILGIEDWSERSLIREPALHRAWYVAPSPAGLKVFKKKFERTYGTGAHRLGPLAYDAMAVALFLGSKASPAFNKNSLTNPRGFLGTAGLFRFREDGIVERNYSIFEVSDKGVLEVGRAGRSFLK
ncbi:MAG: penicillin-binding protein activator [Pseudomonadota bacterium]|nr:penicillin-binding protein activator [Pseudomonadota bacterium]